MIAWFTELKNSLIMRNEWEFFSLLSNQQQREREDTHLEGGTPKFTSQFCMIWSEGILGYILTTSQWSHLGLE